MSPTNSPRPSRSPEKALELKWGEACRGAGCGLPPGVSISSHIDGGNIDVLGAVEDLTAGGGGGGGGAIPSAAEVRLAIHPDPYCDSDKTSHFMWFNFRVTGARGVPLRLRVVNAGQGSFPAAWAGYQAMASYDQERWFRVEGTSYDPASGELAIELTPERDCVALAYFPPFTTAQHERLLARTAAKEGVRLRVAGESLDGHDIAVLSFGEEADPARTAAKLNVTLCCRQHPGETQVSCACVFVCGLPGKKIERAPAPSRPEKKRTTTIDQSINREANNRSIERPTIDQSRGQHGDLTFSLPPLNPPHPSSFFIENEHGDLPPLPSPPLPSPQAEWFAEGLADALSDPHNPKARALLRSAVVHLVPNACPDGASRGHLRTNSAGTNLNRAWKHVPGEMPDSDAAPEAYYLTRFMDARPPDLLIDVHGDEELPHVFIAGAEGVPGFYKGDGSERDADTPLGRKQAHLEKAMLRHLSDFQTAVGYAKDAPGGADMRILSNAAAARYPGSLAVTLEMPYKRLKLPAGRMVPGGTAAVSGTGVELQEDWGPKRCARLGRDMVGVLLQMVPHLGAVSVAP